jgi:adenosylhomocysteine nucleosidase
LVALLLAPRVIAAGESLPQPFHPSPPTLVITAVDYEYDAVVGLLSARSQIVLGGRQVTEGSMGSERIVVVRAGWGNAQAAGATSLAISRFAPKLVVMAGVAEGLDTDNVSSGDVVIGASTFSV